MTKYSPKRIFFIVASILCFIASILLLLLKVYSMTIVGFALTLHIILISIVIKNKTMKVLITIITVFIIIAMTLFKLCGKIT